MLTCKEFLAELSDYLDEKTRDERQRRNRSAPYQVPELLGCLRHDAQDHSGFQGADLVRYPDDVHARLMAAVDRKIAAKKTTN